MGDKSYRIVVVVCIFATVGCLGYIVRDKARFESPVPRPCYACRSATNKRSRTLSGESGKETTAYDLTRSRHKIRGQVKFQVPRESSLTRLGSDLNFDVSSCPAGSLMLENWHNYTPLHDNCPTLFIVGARKGGTTSLYHYMDKHPGFRGIRLNNEPMDGETYYFSLHYDEPWESYISQFPTKYMSGESTVDNLLCPVPRRIFKSCRTQAKIVMLLRDPVLRLSSNFLMRARYGIYEWHPTNMNTRISDEVKSELKILKRKMRAFSPKDWSRFTCIFRPTINMVYEGLYYIFVMDYLCNFPAENILIINSEEFFSSTSQVLAQVYSFLGLKKLKKQRSLNVTSQAFNKNTNPVLPHQVLSSADKARLNYVYRPFNDALFKLLEWNSTLWDA